MNLYTLQEEPNGDLCHKENGVCGNLVKMFCSDEFFRCYKYNEPCEIQESLITPNMVNVYKCAACLAASKEKSGAIAGVGE